jgi:putative ABC transport system permease protein
LFLIESIAQAWHSLKGHKLRTGLTMFGIIWGIASMIILVGMGRSSERLFAEEFQKIGKRMIIIWAGKSSSGLSGLKGGRQIRFTVEDLKAIKDHCPDVELVAPDIGIGLAEAKYGSETLNCSTSGTDENAEIIRNMIVERGRFISSEDVKLRRRVCVLGANVKEKLFGPQPATGEFIRLYGFRFRVVGELAEKGEQMSRVDSPDDDQVLIPFTTAQKLFRGSEYFYRIYLQPYSILRDNVAREQVRATLAHRHGFLTNDADALDSFGTADMMERVKGVNLGLKIFLGAASIVTLLLGGVGVMNIMFVSINERIREIGIIKAVGARKRQVFLQFMTESLLITVFAGLIGAVFGSAVCILIGLFELPRLVAAPDISLSTMIASFLTMIFVGVLSGILPALKASRMQIVDALRTY